MDGTGRRVDAQLMLEADAELKAGRKRQFVTSSMCWNRAPGFNWHDGNLHGAHFNLECVPGALAVNTLVTLTA